MATSKPLPPTPYTLPPTPRSARPRSLPASPSPFRRQPSLQPTASLPAPSSCESSDVPNRANKTTRGRSNTVVPSPTSTSPDDPFLSHTHDDGPRRDAKSPPPDAFYNRPSAPTPDSANSSLSRAGLRLSDDSLMAVVGAIDTYDFPMPPAEPPSNLEKPAEGTGGNQLSNKSSLSNLPQLPGAYPSHRESLRARRSNPSLARRSDGSTAQRPESQTPERRESRLSRRSEGALVHRPPSWARRPGSSVISVVPFRIETPPERAMFPVSTARQFAQRKGNRETLPTPTKVVCPPSPTEAGSPLTRGPSANASRKEACSEPVPKLEIAVPKFRIARQLLAAKRTVTRPLHAAKSETITILTKLADSPSSLKTELESPSSWSPLSAGLKAKERRMLGPCKSAPTAINPLSSSQGSRSGPSGTPMPNRADVKRTRLDALKTAQRSFRGNKVCKLLDLPSELLIQLLECAVRVDSSIIGRLAMTCRYMGSFIARADSVWSCLVDHEMKCLSSDINLLLDSEEKFTTARNTPVVSPQGSPPSTEALPSGSFDGDTSLELFDVSSSSSDQTTPSPTPLRLKNITPRISKTLPLASPSRGIVVSPFDVRTSPKSFEEGPDCSVHVDALFAEMLAKTEPEEHRRRHNLVPRIKRVARVLLNLYHSTEALFDVEAWVSSSAFTGLLRVVCTTPLRQDLLPALRLLCHLQTLCLKRTPPITPIEACTPSSVSADVGHLEGIDLDMPPSERYDILKHLMNVSVTPIFDYDGKVLWEGVLAAEMVMFPLARVVMVEYPAVDHFTRVMDTIAVPGRQLPTPSSGLRSPTGDWRDWAGIHGCWYGLLGRWEVSDNEPRPSVIPHINIGPCDPQSLVDIIKYHDKTSGLKAGRMLPLATGLPWSKALPPVYFHGHSTNGSRTATIFCVRGVARLTMDSPPEVRYTMILRKCGQDVVRFEGVQVGGAQSRRGVIGVAQLLNSNGVVRLGGSSGENWGQFGMPGWFVKL